MGNTVGSLRQYKISSRETSIVIGTLLGDAHIDMLKAGGRLEVAHSEKQKEYLFWKYKELDSFVGAKPHLIRFFDQRYGKTYTRWKFSSKVHRFFTALHNLFYSNRKKVISKMVCQLIESPLTLAVWFMDDGGRRNDSYGLFLNTLSFSRQEHNLLQQCLKRKFSLDTRIHWIQDGYRLYIPSKDAKHFCQLVYPYVIPSMCYKLSYNPVTTSFAQLDRARDRRSNLL